MLRKTTRKTASKATTRGKRVVKRAATAKKAEQGPVIAPAIAHFGQHCAEYAEARKAHFGANDKVAKRMETILGQMSKEMQKHNAFTPVMARSLCSMATCWKGAKGVPQVLRSMLPSLRKFLKEQTARNVTTCFTEMRNHIGPMIVNLCEMEKATHAAVEAARENGAHLHIDSKVANRYAKMAKQMAAFKKDWFKLMNMFVSGGNASVKKEANEIKAGVDEMARCAGRTGTVLTRVSKTKCPRNCKSKASLKAAAMAELEKCWGQTARWCKEAAHPSFHVAEQVKAIKLF